MKIELYTFIISNIGNKILSQLCHQRIMRYQRSLQTTAVTKKWHNIPIRPLHFLGFNVMPRRVPDFPDSFHSWNFLSSIGSGITFLSFAMFSLSFLIIFFLTFFLSSVPFSGESAIPRIRLQAHR